MSRERLRTALAARGGGDAAVVPLIGSHAAHLEQVPEIAFLTDPEIQARALRNAQALYRTDAVTIGSGIDTLAIAARLAAGSQGDAAAARRDTVDGAALETLPDPKDVLGQDVVGTELEAMRRLRPVLDSRAGIALVLPSADRLAALLGDAGAVAWCGSALRRAVGLYGALEPDLLITVGETDTGPLLGAVCDHFGVALVHLGAPAANGIVAVPGAEFAHLPGSEGAKPGWLYTTTTEIPAAADPGAVKDAVAALRGLA